MRLMEILDGTLSPTTTNEWGRSIGQSPDVAARMSQHALPLLAAGFAHHGSTETGASRLLQMMHQPSYPGGSPAGYDASTFGSPRAFDGSAVSGDSLLTHLFGHRLDELTGLFSSEYGYSPTHSRSLFALMAPFVLGHLGRHFRSSNYDARALSSYFSGEMPSLASRLPSRFHPFFGLGTNVRPVTTSTVRERHPGIVVHRKPAPGRWAIPLVLLALIGGWLIAHHHSENRNDRVVATQPYERPGTAPVGQGVDALAAYAASDDTDVPRRFNLEDIRFETGTTRVVGGGEQAIHKLAQVMKDERSMRIRIDGYADATGDSPANRSLSKARATAVREALVKQGVAADRLQIGAGGESNPVAPNDSAHGRQLNRRVEATVLSK